MRSCVYVIKMDAYSRWASVDKKAGVLRPIDEMVSDLCVRRRKGEKVQTKDWLQNVGKWIGLEAAEEHFRNMLSGKVMSLEDMKTGFDGLTPQEQSILDMGFDRSSLDSGVVSGVTQGSSAADAGIRDGDVIQWYSRAERCQMQYEEKFKLIVKRGDEDVTLEYWPRTSRKAEVWQALEKEVK
jgi:predicted metalloprotease with PDZ domain